MTKMNLFFVWFMAALAFAAAENEKFNEEAFKKELDAMKPEELQELGEGSCTV